MKESTIRSLDEDFDEIEESTSKFKKRIESIAERTRDVDFLLSKSKPNIEVFNKSFSNIGLTWIQRREIENKILNNSKDLLKKGVDLSSISKDYNKSFEFSLDILEKSNIKGKKRQAVEDILFQQYLKERKIQEQYLKKKQSISKSYDKVANFFEIS